MDGGDLIARSRPVRGGDLTTMSRQHGGFLFLAPFAKKLFGLGPEEMQKAMSDPIKAQMLMQRGGFPWALAGLSMLPMLLGKGEEDVIQNQMRTTRDPIMQRGGLSIPPALLSKALPLLKTIGVPLAMGALASIGDNVVDKVFGEGKRFEHRNKRRRQTRAKPVRERHRKPRAMRARRSPIQGKPKSTTPTRLRDVGRQLFERNLENARDGLRKAGRRLLDKKKGRARKELKRVGRRLFDSVKSKSEKAIPLMVSNDTQFTKNLQDSIRANLHRAPNTTANSSNIGQTINI